MKQMTQDWLEYAQRDHTDAQALLHAKRYHGALFFYQQAVEKIIKAYLIENSNEKIPFVHDIRYLLESTKLTLLELDHINLKDISLVYTRLRYPDMDRKYFTKNEEVNMLIEQFEFLHLWTHKQFKNK